MFLRRLQVALAARSHDEAFVMLANILNEVEDEHSGVPMSPSRYLDDGRLYPPQADNRRTVPGRDDLVRYRSRRHNVWVGINGAIRIDAVAIGGNVGTCVLSKPGADGRQVEFRD